MYCWRYAQHTRDKEAEREIPLPNDLREHTLSQGWDFVSFRGSLMRAEKGHHVEMNIHHVFLAQHDYEMGLHMEMNIHHVFLVNSLGKSSGVSCGPDQLTHPRPDGIVGEHGSSR